MGRSLARLVVVVLAMLCGVGVASQMWSPASASTEENTYTAVNPCAVADSRASQGALAPFAGAYMHNVARTIQVTGFIPAAQGGGNPVCVGVGGADAVLVNVVAVNPLKSGNLRAYPTGTPVPLGGIVNFAALTPTSLFTSNTVAIPLSASGQIDVNPNCTSGSCTDVRVVVLGYFTDDLKTKVDDMGDQLDDLYALLQGVSRIPSGIGGQPTLQFSGMNVQIVDGSGDTECDVVGFETCNGRGNLVLGYSELGQNLADGSRQGAHNLVSGTENQWYGHSGVVTGFRNEIDGPNAVVVGGDHNCCDGVVIGGSNNLSVVSSSVVVGGRNNNAGIGVSYATLLGGRQNTVKPTASVCADDVDAAVVVGGRFNIASGCQSVVAGGGGVTASLGNTASGDFSVVSAGARNKATALGSAVSGGSDNTASAGYASATGGAFNTASGGNAVVSGGSSNMAGGLFGSVSGGDHNSASGVQSSVSGGVQNSASGTYTAVSGGMQNTASDGCADATMIAASSVGGGRFNVASGSAAAILGGGASNGPANQAQGTYSVISGGKSNIASGDHASVAGGTSNNAVAAGSMILGGRVNSTLGEDAVVLGGVENDGDGEFSTVSGGIGNTASASGSSMIGGLDNRASDGCSDTNFGNLVGNVVVGGWHNTASGCASAVVGGGGKDLSYGNTASGSFSVVSGGVHNQAADGCPDVDVVAGSAVLGGRNNVAGGCAAVVSGGGGSALSAGNFALGQYSSITGGQHNTATGQNSSITGGNTLTVSAIDGWAAGGIFHNP